MTKLTIAKHISGRIISIRDAANGLACGCICSCGERLSARQGDSNDWSFAHESGTECAGALQTVLHEYAIQLIADEKRLYIGEYDPISSSPKRLPKYYLEDFYNHYKTANPNAKLSEFEYFSNKEIAITLLNAVEQCAKSRITFSEAYSEKRAEGSVRQPDVTGIYKGQKIYVEIVVTHKCDEEKISELIKLGVPTIQINISSLLQKELNLETIKAAILNLTNSQSYAVKREWLVKPKYIQEADQIAAEYFDLAKTKLQELKFEENEPLPQKRPKRKIIVVDQVELHIFQRETWGTIWFSERISRLTPAIKFIFDELNANRTDCCWTVQEHNILEKIQNLQATIAKQEKIKQDKEIANIERREKYRRRLEKERQAHAKRERQIKAREEEIIAEVEKKYQGIINYQFRLKKIIDELSAQGIRYR